jgi:hypothetical protein
MSQVPHEILKLILVTLDAKNFLRISSMCKTWKKKFSKDPLIWRHFLKRDFDVTGKENELAFYEICLRLRRSIHGLQDKRTTENQKYVLGKITDKVVIEGKRNILVDVHNGMDTTMIIGHIVVENALYNPESTTIVLNSGKKDARITRGLINYLLKDLNGQVKHLYVHTELSNGSSIQMAPYSPDDPIPWTRLKNPHKDLIIIDRFCDPLDTDDEIFDIHSLRSLHRYKDHLENYALAFASLASPPQPIFSTITEELYENKYP